MLFDTAHLIFLHLCLGLDLVGLGILGILSQSTRRAIMVYDYISQVLRPHYD